MLQKLSLRKKLGLEVFRLLHKREVKEHVLKILFWECTVRCNLSCRHCGSDCKKVEKTPDMPLEDFMKVIDELTPHVNPNKTMIIIGGGEALVRDDVEECGRQLYDRGYPWGMVTNAMLLDRKRLDSMLAAGLRSLCISLDGFEDFHNDFRGNPQSFQRAVRAIKMLVQEKDLAWDIVTCATSINFDSLPDFKEYLISLGVKNWRVFTVFPAGRALTDKALQVSDEQYKKLMEFIVETRKEGRIKVSYGCEGFLGNYETEVRDRFYNCMAGVNIASVLVDGSISGCTSIRSNFHQGNIYKDSFVDVWNNGFQQYRHREWAKKGQCAKCDMFRYCEGNGMHLYDENENLKMCNYKRLK